MSCRGVAWRGVSSRYCKHTSTIRSSIDLNPSPIPSQPHGTVDLVALALCIRTSTLFGYGVASGFKPVEEQEQESRRYNRLGQSPDQIPPVVRFWASQKTSSRLAVFKVAVARLGATPRRLLNGEGSRIDISFPTTTTLRNTPQTDKWVMGASRHIRIIRSRLQKERRHQQSLLGTERRIYGQAR